MILIFLFHITLLNFFHYLHVGKLLHGRETREVEPRHVLSVFVVISLVLQVPEGCSAQSVKLQSVLLSIWTCHNIDIYSRWTNRKNVSMFPKQQIVTTGIMTTIQTKQELAVCAHCGQFVTFVFYPHLTLCPHPSGFPLKWSLPWSTKSSEPNSRILRSSACIPARLKSTWNITIRHHLHSHSVTTVTGGHLTLGALIDHKFVLDQFSEDLVASSVLEAGDGGQETHWDNLVVLHSHFNLWSQHRNNMTVIRGDMQPDNYYEAKRQG